MDKFGFLFGVRAVYAILIILDLSAGWYLLNHFPKTFDLGYVGSVFACLFLLVSIIKSIPLIRKVLDGRFQSMN